MTPAPSAPALVPRPYVTTNHLLFAAQPVGMPPQPFTLGVMLALGIIVRRPPLPPIPLPLGRADVAGGEQGRTLPSSSSYPLLPALMQSVTMPGPGGGARTPPFLIIRLSPTFR